MEELEALGVLSVRRGCAFAALGIGTLMFGYLDRPAVAMAIGAACSMLGCFILLLKRNALYRQDYRKTELWMLLPEERRPPASVAARVVPQVLGDIYLNHSRVAAAISAVLCVVAIGCQLGQ